jgi:outer membrane protein OmpA-like peptidoglycan-associated protein
MKRLNFPCQRPFQHCVRNRSLILVATLVWAAPAAAEEPRIHISAGAAHAIGPPQQREFGAGGGGAATVELPAGKVVGVQASAGAVVLSRGSAPTDPTLAQQGTGSAFLGTVGVRVRPFGAQRVAGPWIDANGGVAQTGNAPHVAVDAHVGWDFRVARETRWDVGPFIGFTQILQSNSALRPDDARILWAGIVVSLGAQEKPRPAPEPTLGRQPAPPVTDEDGVAEVVDVCARDQGDGTPPPDCLASEIKIVGDRIELEDVIHFEYDSARIRGESRGLVRRVASFIVANPSILEVSIEGHADARGTEDYNQHLSEERAASTRAMLVEYGVDEPRLHVVGHGKSRLKVATQLADPRNRRVEFVVSRSADVSSSPSRSAAATSGKRGQR